MTREEIKNTVIEIVASKMGFLQSEISESTSFKADLGTDSLDDIELLMEFEHAFGINIPDEEMMGVVTVGDVINDLSKKLSVVEKSDMKAPDKIYIAETPNKLIEIWSDEPIESKPYITEHEYIRKYALMEWVKELKFHLKNRSGLQYKGANIVIDGIINKIESL